ncbi:hypothetical protein Q3O60_03675 [Alkalimonas collagenimarina]|uniref:N-acetyltransferase domain-containing protein n=1 Tax=Alkalimonas collagenimarina TaxID=400390 RepID=A0ABT9GW75_9GAMM|nr:hypothetical protein [Alkalimonas collagenimarina]MDP4535287.1 hypothetical protein [Alkalimonas collagenimarina]
MSGKYQGQGICDALIRSVSSQLTGYRHELIELPQARIGLLLDRAEPMCFPCMIHKPEGESRALYSEPTHHYKSHGIITTSEKARLLRQRYGNNVSLSELFMDSHWRFGHPAGRRFGMLQPLIEQAEQHSRHSFALSGDQGPMAVMAMVAADRLDFTIDYAMVLHYYNVHHQTQLELLPILELDQQKVAGAIGCTNNEWGQQVTDAINVVLPQVKRDPDFNQALQLWMQ